jgi:toxin ParE1/3/4
MKPHKLRFSEQAGSDMLGIAEYSLREWGEMQAARYLAGLAACCRRVGDSPMIGRACSRILPGLRRIEQVRHVVFFLLTDGDVLIVRVLHKSMQPERWIHGEEG